MNYFLAIEVTEILGEAEEGITVEPTTEVHDIMLYAEFIRQQALRFQEVMGIPFALIKALLHCQSNRNYFI